MESEIFTQHISRKYNAELEELRTQVSEMGGLVERQLSQAVQALTEADSQLGLDVAAQDVEVNAYEVSIDEDCGRILATRAPAAADLRLIVAVIKAITDLERMGDEAERIGTLAANLASAPQSENTYTDLGVLGEHVKEMVHDSLDAFTRLDVRDALEVVERDKAIDKEYNEILRQCIVKMGDDPDGIEHFMDVSWAARALERIGDHSKNICEYIIYLVHGKDVRHIKLKDIKKTVKEQEKQQG